MNAHVPVRRLAVVVAVVLVALLGWHGTASAHASLLSSEPADGSSLPSSPHAVTLRFDSFIDIGRSSAQLIDQFDHVVGDSGGVGTARLTLTGTSAADVTSREVVVALPTLTAGAYQVRWRAVDALDLHVTQGTVVFGVARSAGPTAAVSDPWPPALSVLATWAQLLAFVLMIGAIFVGWLLASVKDDDAPSMTRVRRRLRRTAVAAALTGALAGVAVIGLRIADTGGGSSSSLAILSTSYGHRWLVGEAATVALALVVLATRVRAGRATRAVFDVLIVGLVGTFVVTQTVTSHLAATAGGSAVTTVAAVVHLVGASVWVGGLIAITACLSILKSAEMRAIRRDLLRRFGWTAAPCAAAVVVSGLVLAGRQVLTVDALLFTHYGRLLMAKVALAALVGAFGARNALTNRTSRSAATRVPRRRLLAVECAVAIAVIGLAAALANGKPARGPEYQPVATQLPPPLNAQIRDLLVGLSVRPDRPGPDFVSVSILNTRVPAPAPVSAVKIQLTAPPPLGRTVDEIAVKGADGTWADTTTAIDRSGPWRIHVEIERPGMPNVVLDTTWQVLEHPSSFTQHTRVSTTTLKPSLDAAAIAVAVTALVLGAGVVTIGARRRKRHKMTDATNVEPEVVDSLH
jgi:copper transport protein